MVFAAATTRRAPTIVRFNRGFTCVRRKHDTDHSGNTSDGFPQTIPSSPELNHYQDRLWQEHHEHGAGGQTPASP